MQLSQAAALRMGWRHTRKWCSAAAAWSRDAVAFQWKCSFPEVMLAALLQAPCRPSLLPSAGLAANLWTCHCSALHCTGSTEFIHCTHLECYFHIWSCWNVKLHHHLFSVRFGVMMIWPQRREMLLHIFRIHNSSWLAPNAIITNNFRCWPVKWHPLQHQQWVPKANFQKYQA